MEIMRRWGRERELEMRYESVNAFIFFFEECDIETGKELNFFVKKFTMSHGRGAEIAESKF
jgi:hypothetical protein